MTPEIAYRLREINRDFYEALALPFARSRSHDQPGYTRLLDYLPRPCPTLLDVGCGEGRFGRFLLAHQAIEHYVGVDFTPALLAEAQRTTPGRYYQRDLTQPGCLDGLGSFPAIACLSTLQHIPGRANRLRLLVEMKTHLQPAGILLLANWQFLDSPRQRRKIVPWEQVGLTAGDVEANDYLLNWQRGGEGLRYVALLDRPVIESLAADAGLAVVDHFRRDGREGNLNLYTILA